MKAAAIVMAQTLYHALNKIEERREFIDSLRDAHANSPRPSSALNGLYSWDEIDDSRLDVAADDPERCHVDVENIDDDCDGNGLVPGEAEHPGRALPDLKEKLVEVKLHQPTVYRRYCGSDLVPIAFFDGWVKVTPAVAKQLTKARLVVETAPEPAPKPSRYRGPSDAEMQAEADRIGRLEDRNRALYRR